MCALSVKAPPTEGQFAIRLTLVQEHIRWFDDVDEANGWTAWVRIVPAINGVAHSHENGRLALAVKSAVEC
jgi:hypothetical protein